MSASNAAAAAAAAAGKATSTSAAASLNSSRNDPLSRASLYAPLSNYNEDPGSSDNDNDKQQARKRTRRRTAKSSTETSLIHFLQAVSEDYHRNNNSNNNLSAGTATTAAIAAAAASSSSSSYHYGYNSGSRPLGLRDCTEAIQGRAILLVGGRRHYNHGMMNKPDKKTSAIMTTLAASSSSTTGGAAAAGVTGNPNKISNKASNSSTVVSSSSSARPKRKRQRPRGKINGSSGKCSIPLVFDSRQQEQQEIDFLLQLNHLWNEYACTILLQLNNVQSDPPIQRQSGSSRASPVMDALSPENRSRLSEVCRRQPDSILHDFYRLENDAGATATAPMEWVGAMVRIEHCRQHASWNGLSGILVTVTANTWQLIQVTPVQKDSTTSTSLETKKEGADSHDSNNDQNNDKKQSPQEKAHTHEQEEDAELDSSSSPQWSLKRRLIVPKRGSSLSVLLPIPPTTDEESPNRDEKEDTDDDNEYNAATQTLCITLQGPQDSN